MPELITYVESGELTLEAAAAVAPLVIARPAQALEVLESVKNKPLREVECIVADAAPRLVRDSITPIGNGRYRISFMSDQSFVRTFERLRGLLRHKYPDGRMEDIFMEAIAEYLNRHDPLLRSPRPRPKARHAGSGPIPKWLRDEVWRRDGGRCAWLNEDGTKCGAMDWIEVDHILPRALGGANALENLRLLCRPHNQHAARAFGLLPPEGRA